MKKIFFRGLALVACLNSCGNQNHQSQLTDKKDPLTKSVRAENGMGQHYSDPSHPVVRFAVEVAQKFKPKTVLEFATGRGLVAKSLLRETPIQFIHATDIHAPWIQSLQKDFSAQPQRATASVLSAGEPIPKNFAGKFDLVVAKDMFPFLNPTQVHHFLKNAFTALKPEGLLVFSFPITDSRLYRESLPTIDPFYRRLTTAQMRFIQTTLSHFSFASEESITNLLEENHFEIESMKLYGRSEGWAVVQARKIGEMRR